MFTLIETMASVTPLELSRLLVNSSLGVAALAASVFVLDTACASVAAFVAGTLSCLPRGIRRCLLPTSTSVLSVFAAKLVESVLTAQQAPTMLRGAAAGAVLVVAYTLLPSQVEAVRLKVSLLAAWRRELRQFVPQLPVIALVAFLLGSMFLASKASMSLWIPVLAVITGLAVYASALSCRMQEVFSSTLSTLVPLISRKQEYSYEHGLWVACLAAGIADKLLLPRSYVRSVYYGGLLHDLGFVGIPEELTSRPTPLKLEEFSVVASHPEVGAAIAAKVEALKEAATLVRHHHERWDGKGYPDQLRGDQIPLGARIIAIAECYVALRTDRPYRKGMSSQEALAELKRNCGLQFDSNLLEVLVDLVKEQEEYGLGFLLNTYCFDFCGSNQRWQAESPGKLVNKALVGAGNCSGPSSGPPLSCR
ncbi:MAG: HD-GYP domain-containing protein [Bacillota bacterium]